MGSFDNILIIISFVCGLEDTLSFKHGLYVLEEIFSI